MAFLTLNTISLKTPDLAHTLVSDLTINFGCERTGLVGRNGCGKSSLLAVMAGHEQPTAGTVTFSGSIGLFRQRFDYLSVTVIQALGVQDAFDVISRIISGTGSQADFGAADWTLEARIEAALAQVGLEELQPDTPLSQLSGGQRMRVSMARTILEDADLLLLDEPTNNLDSAGRHMIAELVAGWHGGVVIAEHDRALLEGMDRILELSQTGAHLYTGGWSAYRAEKKAAVARAETELDRAQRGFKSTEVAIQRQHEKKARRDKAGRMRRAKDADPRVYLDRQKSRAEKSLGRENQVANHLINDAASALEAAAEQVEILTPIHIDFPTSRIPTSRTLLRMEAAEFHFMGGRSLGPWKLEIRGPERVRLIGLNGAGKSTMMKLAAGLLVASKGQVERMGQAAYLDQDLSMPLPDRSLIDNMLDAQPAMTEHDARAALSRFGFRNVTADRAVSGLSGGERLRLSLCMTAFGVAVPELLLLDEPTNHLDVEAVELLEATLQGYQGAILFVTHDERFADALQPDRFVDVSNAKAATRHSVSRRNSLEADNASRTNPGDR